MCDTLRNTRRRGRSDVPLIRFLWRSAMRTRRSFLVLIFIVLTDPGRGRTLLGSRLASLLLQHLARVADPLLLVGIRLAERSNVGGHLADQLTIDPGHGHVRLLVDRDVDARRYVEHDGMRVAEREVDLLALD